MINTPEHTLDEYMRVPDLPKTYPAIFPSRRATYAWIDKHRSELAMEGALIRMGTGPRATMLVHPHLLVKVMRRWADGG